MAAESAAAVTRNLQVRMVAWVNSTLTNSRIMRQYAADLPELINVAFEQAFGAAIRGRARDVCRRHTNDLMRNIRDLRRDLARAFPRPAAKPAGKPAAKNEARKKTPAVLPSIVDRADGIADAARVLSGRIYRFIYPAQHTVDLEELRRPGLLVSLDAIEAETRDFQQALARMES